MSIIRRLLKYLGLAGYQPLLGDVEEVIPRPLPFYVADMNLNMTLIAAGMARCNADAKSRRR